jgi:hypothetical protein
LVRRSVKPRSRSAPPARNTTPRRQAPRCAGVAAADEGSDAVRPLLGPGLEERLLASWKPYLEIEWLGDRLAVTRRSWIEPKDVRTMLDQAAWILDDLARASRH